MENDYDLAVEELKDASNPVEKQMLLQKYGMIEPKITREELKLIDDETKGYLCIRMINDPLFYDIPTPKLVNYMENMFKEQQ